MKLSYTVFPLSIVLFQNELVLHNSLVLHKSKWKSVFVWDLNLLYCRLYHITITILGLLFQCKTALHTEWLLQCTFFQHTFAQHYVARSCGVNTVPLGIKFLQTICASVHLHLICPHLLWNIEETEMEKESGR